MLFYAALGLLLLLLAVLAVVSVRRYREAKKPHVVVQSSSGTVPKALTEWHKLCEDLKLAYVLSDDNAAQLRAGTLGNRLVVRLVSEEENEHFKNLIAPDLSIVEGFRVVQEEEENHSLVHTPSGSVIVELSTSAKPQDRELVQGLWVCK